MIKTNDLKGNIIMENLKSYAIYFSAYLIDNFKELKSIKNIILFGSVARGEYNKESDIDIFIELDEKTSKIEKQIREIVERFYKTRESLIFKSTGIDNKINLKIGKLSDWQDLEKSIASEGIILYGRYVPKNNLSGSRPFIIIYWDKIGKNRGAFLNKIYGFKSKDKKYPGLLEKLKGKKLGKSCIMIPSYDKSSMYTLIKEHIVSAKSFEVYL